MKAKLFDKKMQYVKTLELSGQNPEIADTEVDAQRHSLPQEKMKVAKFKVRFYRLICIQGNTLYYVEGKGRFGMPLFEKEIKQQPIIKAPFERKN